MRYFAPDDEFLAFLAVHGATDTDTIFLGSMFIFLAKYVLTIADSIAIQLRAEEIWDTYSGKNVSQNFTHAGQQLVNCGNGPDTFQ